MQSSPDIVFDERDDLVAALKARLPWARALDKRRKAEHAAAERDYLDAFKARCRDALKWSYADFKRANFEIEAPYRDRPSCPSMLVPQVEEALRSLALSSQRKFTIKSGHQLHHLLTFDETAKTEAC